MNEHTPTPERRVRQGMDYGETGDVQMVHAAIQREKREPRVGLEPLSIWLIAVYGLAIFFGGAYLGRFSGNFSGDGLDPLGGAPRSTHGVSGPGQEDLRLNSHPPSAAKRFSLRTAPSVINPMDSARRARVIRRWPARSGSRVGPNGWA